MLEGLRLSSPNIVSSRRVEVALLDLERLKVYVEDDFGRAIGIHCKLNNEEGPIPEQAVPFPYPVAGGFAS